jgi:hypothetical protein
VAEGEAGPDAEVFQDVADHEARRDEDRDRAPAVALRPMQERESDLHHDQRQPYARNESGDEQAEEDNNGEGPQCGGLVETLDGRHLATPGFISWPAASCDGSDPSDCS